MPCGLLEVLKVCFGLRRHALQSKQTRCRFKEDPIDDVPTFKHFTIDTHKIMMQEISRNGVIDLNASDTLTPNPVVSIVQLDVTRKESSSDSHSDHHSSPLSIDIHLQTEYEFLSAIYQAQLYKNACTGAEENARQLFEHCQEMRYLNTTLHARSIEAQKNLQRLQQSAQEVGLSQLACFCVGNVGVGCGEEGCSADVVGYSLLRLDEDKTSPPRAATHSRSRSL